MNRVFLTGRILGKTFPFGEGLKGIRFLLRTPYKYSQAGQSNEGSSVVPCLIFQCPEELKGLLLSADKDLWIEAEGRINRSSYEASDGERKYSTEVVLNPLTAFVHKR